MESEWQAMNRAGEAVGDSLLRDMREFTYYSTSSPYSYSCGKGTQWRRCIGCGQRLLKTIPTARALVWPYCSWDEVVLYASEHTMK